MFLICSIVKRQFAAGRIRRGANCAGFVRRSSLRAAPAEGSDTRTRGKFTWKAHSSGAPAGRSARVPALSRGITGKELLMAAPTVTMQQLIEAGAHFGHQTHRWNPRMKPYIFGARNGIYIIDLQKTVNMARAAFRFVADITGRGGSVLFVGTKKQAQDVIQEEARRAGQFFVTSRWL